MRKNLYFVQRERRLLVVGEAVSTFLDRHGGKERRHLVALWRDWPVVMGEELAALAYPLGHKDGILFVGADDAMAMQDLSLQSMEILERANAFMDSEFFRQVKLSLVRGQGRPDLCRPRRPDPPLRPVPPQKPARLGGLAGKLNPASPVTRCYEAYLAMFADPGTRW